MQFPSHLQTLFAQLRKLPGVGHRTAERYAFQLLEWPPEQLQRLAQTLAELPQRMHHCTACGALAEAALCTICQDRTRDPHQLCILGHVRDVYAFEDTGAFHGLYHILGGLLSPLERRGPESIGLERLHARIQGLQVQEVILALDTTLEGDATALFLHRELEALGCRVTRLAFGLPLGSSLEYVDGGTLARALAGRQQLI
ncbi:MAG: recombination mediator RecR [Chlamydiia bacterium]